MTLSELSIKRPIFITCLVILIVSVGLLSLKKLAVDLFPNINLPIIVVHTVYPGAGPNEIELTLSKVLEEEMSTVSGLSTLRSISREGVSVLIAEFTLETDIKYAEQQIRDRVASVKRKLPVDIKEPVIRRVDPADQPILMLSLEGDLKETELYDVADQMVRPKLEQVSKVGLVEVSGGRKREIHVNLDRRKLKSHDLSASMVVNRMASTGQNIPVGKITNSEKETIFRTLGEFISLKDIGKQIVNFFGNEVPVTINELGSVVDSLEEETSKTYVNGKKGLLLKIYKQSGANTIAVADAIEERVKKLNSELEGYTGKPTLTLVRDGAYPVRANVQDVQESIFYGLFLTILVVYFFLGSGRSTFITGIAIPNSLLGAFIVMAVAGFTINIMTLLALSLSVGLLIDDAIVVRENIFRHIQNGVLPFKAAIEGTKEVTLAVIATTLTMVAVFGPIAFLQGVVGQFFKEFGLTICFAMAISLFDALTVAPMLSAYFVGSIHVHRKNTLWNRTAGKWVDRFEEFQEQLSSQYEKVIHASLKHPVWVLGGSFIIFILSLWAVKHVPKTFLGSNDLGEFSVSLELPQGTSLTAMDTLAKQVDRMIRENKEVTNTVLTVGGNEGQSNSARFYVDLVSSKERVLSTSEFKDKMRSELKAFAHANPRVTDIDLVMGGQVPFNLAIIGTDFEQLEKVSKLVFERIRQHPALKDVDISYKPGKPEFQVSVDRNLAGKYGVTSSMVGQELRIQMEGTTPAVFRENGKEFNIRVKLKEEDQNLKQNYRDTFVPNINYSLVRLADVSKPVETIGPSNINRQDRGRYIMISADLDPKGPGMGSAIADITKMFETDVKLPSGMRYDFVGQTKNFKELIFNMLVAAGFGVLFIYLVLSSLYESFIIPFSIMLALPLAVCGAFTGLYVTGKSLDIFSMIGCIMLLGLVTKNSILLVDYANQLIAKGSDVTSAITKAGRVRLRPILMTTFALIAGMLPVALGLNEAAKQRTGMGIAIIGGLISSTILSLIVIPVAFKYVEAFRLWILSKMNRNVNIVKNAA